VPAPNLTASAVLSSRGTERLRLGHPWIYRSDIATAKAEPGDLVLVKSERGRPLGWALWSSQSQIALRFVSMDGNVNDATLWRDRLITAIAYRDALALDGTACRLVHGEADRLPALIVDRYDDVLVMQTLCQGMDRRRDQIAQELVNMLMPRGIPGLQDPKVRPPQGLGDGGDGLERRGAGAVQERNRQDGRFRPGRGGVSIAEGVSL